MQANWDETDLTQVGFFVVQTWDEKYLAHVIRLTSYKQPLKFT